MKPSTSPPTCAASRKEALRARDVALETWQLGPLRHIYSPRLSGGQQRLLQLAVALVGLPHRHPR